MRSLLALSACLVFSAGEELMPFQDTQLFILLDATTWDQRLLQGASQAAATQLADVLSAYEAVGLSFEVAVATFGAASSECFYMKQHFTSDLAEIKKSLEHPPTFDKQPESDQSDRNIFNAIMHAAASNWYRKDKHTRRVIMVITDDIGDFGPGNDVDPYFSNCPESRPTPQQVSQVVQDNEVGIIVSISCAETWNWQFDKYKIDVTRSRFRQTSLTDWTVDGNTPDSPFDGVSNHLIGMLGTTHLATTSTTTVRTTSQSYKVNPDRDIELLFLFDAATDDTEGYHLSFASQRMIDQLEDLFEKVQESGFTLSVGADVFGALNGTCIRGLMDFTSSYERVRKQLSNPPTFDQSDVQAGVNRNTYNALRYATAKFNKSKDVRKLLVLLTDHIPAFGSGNSIGPGSCIQEQASATQLKTAIEDSRAGLLINIFANKLQLAEKRKTFYKSIVDAAGLTDISYNADAQKEDWDAIKWHVAKMISKEWIATTSTTTKAMPECMKTCTPDEILAWCTV